MIDREGRSATAILSISDAVPDLVTHHPEWFPYGVALEGVYQIPVLDRVDAAALPDEMWAFEKRRQARDLSRTLLHFYVADRKLRAQIHKPQKHVANFAGAWGVTSPDFSIGSSMPPQHRIMSVWANRAVGCFYQSRGHRVVPTIRWCDRRDFDYAFLGVTKGSLLSISNYGCRRNSVLWHGFLEGLPELVDRLEPPAVLVYGTTDHWQFRKLKSRTDFIQYEPDINRVQRRAA